MVFYLYVLCNSTDIYLCYKRVTPVYACKLGLFWGKLLQLLLTQKALCICYDGSKCYDGRDIP